MTQANKETRETRCPVCAGRDLLVEKPYPNQKKRFLQVTNLAHCKACGLFFAYPMPTKTELDNYYSAGVYYRDKQPDNPEFKAFSYAIAESRLELIARFVDQKASLRLLDIGAGNAILGKVILKKKPNISYDIVEPSPEIADLRDSGVRTAYQWITDIRKQEYDIVTLNQVLEHVNHPLDFIKSIQAHLKKGGLLYVDVPNRDDRFKEAVEPHVLFWDSTSIRYTLERAGFNILFLSSAGMTIARAGNYFAMGTSLTQRLLSPDRWTSRFNAIFNRLKLPFQFRHPAVRQSRVYGADRQWLRCVAQYA